MLFTISLDVPAVREFIEIGAYDSRFEFHVPAQIKFIDDVIDVAQDLGLGRITLRPGPFTLNFVRERIGVSHALDIAAQTRIAIPIPGAARPRACFDDLRLEPQSAQPLEHVNPGESGTHDDRVEFHEAHGQSPSSRARRRFSARALGAALRYRLSRG